MSNYEELQQFVAVIASDAREDAERLAGCAGSIEKCAAVFSHLTAATSDPAAKHVGASFQAAQKQLLLAAKALAEASKAGSEWCGVSVPELKLVLKRRVR